MILFYKIMLVLLFLTAMFGKDLKSTSVIETAIWALVFAVLLRGN